MGFSTNIAELSARAGQAGDGVVRGRITPQIPIAYLYGSSLITISQVLKKDITPTGLTWVDVTTAATDSITGDFTPFGSISTMSNGDAFYFRTQNDVDTHIIYAQIDVAGVGSWDLSAKEWSVAQDAWVEVTGLVDASNSFRNGPGVYRISYTSGSEGKVRLDDTHPTYVWHKIELINFVSVSVAPVLSRIWTADSAMSLTDITSVETSTFAALPAEELPAVGNYSVLIHPGPPIGRNDTITRSRSTNYTCIYEYLATNGSWKPIPSIIDQSNDWKAAPGIYQTRWSLPNDWTSNSITDNAGVAHVGWVERCRIITVILEGPVLPPQAISRSVSFGSNNAEGVYHQTTTTYTALTYDLAVPSSTDVNISLYAASTGNGSTVIIPANSRSSSSLSNGRLNCSITIAAGDGLIISHGGGGIIQDMEVRLT